MQLIKPLESHLLEMMNWFSNEQALTEWSGPNFRYPFDLTSFTEDLKFKTLASFALISNDAELLGFGQYYQRLGKCHLGRLIINPQYRGQGIALGLMQHICELGLKTLEVKECSLFVLAHNGQAIKAYEKFGFAFADYPEVLTLDNCLYMVKV